MSPLADSKGGRNTTSAVPSAFLRLQEKGWHDCTTGFPKTCRATPVTFGDRQVEIKPVPPASGNSTVARLLRLIISAVNVKCGSHKNFKCIQKIQG